jgi:hypothetical protein
MNRLGGCRVRVTDFAIWHRSVATDIYRNLPTIIQGALGLVLSSPLEGARTQLYLGMWHCQIASQVCSA